MSAATELKRQIDQISEKFAGAILKTEMDRAGCPIFWVKREQIQSVLRGLKESEGLEFRFMADLTAYDTQGLDEESEGRFVVVYNLMSPQYRTRIRVKTRAAEDVAVPTATGVWESANWAEREVFDMFGVRFEGHPDLRRILMDVRWQGHPLRKDYYWRKYQLFNEPEQIPEHLLKD